MGMGGGKGGHGRVTMSEINVTPMVDVMLVLLIIFMVTAPLIQQGVKVNLPGGEGRAGGGPGEEAGPLDRRRTSASSSASRGPARRAGGEARDQRQAQADKEIYLHADRDVPTAGGRGDGRRAARRRRRRGMITDPTGSLDSGTRATRAPGRTSSRRRGCAVGPRDRPARRRRPRVSPCPASRLADRARGVFGGSLVAAAGVWRGRGW